MINSTIKYRHLITLKQQKKRKKYSENESAILPLLIALYPLKRIRIP